MSQVNQRQYNDDSADLFGAMPQRYAKSISATDSGSIRTTTAHVMQLLQNGLARAPTVNLQSMRAPTASKQES
jgi:hypothetical protein